jgi:hypothetical protein
MMSPSDTSEAVAGDQDRAMEDSVIFQPRDIVAKIRLILGRLIYVARLREPRAVRPVSAKAHTTTRTSTPRVRRRAKSTGPALVSR